MANLNIRDLDDDVYRSLRMQAAAAGLSLSEYLRGQLRRLAADEAPGARRARRAEVLDRARERRDGVPATVIVEAVREGRDGR